MLGFTKNSTHLVVTGKTFPIKDSLKALGARWDPTVSAWTLPAHLDSEHLRSDLNNKLKEIAAVERAEKKKAAAYAASPEGIAEAKEKQRNLIIACLEEKKKTGAYHWICCEKCEVIDWARKHTSCRACADWDGQSWNSFCVNGRRYTGD